MCTWYSTYWTQIAQNYKLKVNNVHLKYPKSFESKVSGVNFKYIFIRTTQLYQNVHNSTKRYTNIPKGTQVVSSLPSLLFIWDFCGYLFYVLFFMHAIIFLTDWQHWMLHYYQDDGETKVTLVLCFKKLYRSVIVGNKVYWDIACINTEFMAGHSEWMKYRKVSVWLYQSYITGHFYFHSSSSSSFFYSL